MELNITNWFNDQAENAHTYSGSCAELGQNAGTITWNHSKDSANEYPGLLDTEEKREAFREYIDGFGAWDSEDVAQWPDTELTALLIQFIAGDLRELEAYTDETEPREVLRTTETVENTAGRLFIGTDNEIYYYIGG